jgi:hypothetical protein
MSRRLDGGSSDTGGRHPVSVETEAPAWPAPERERWS